MQGFIKLHRRLLGSSVFDNEKLLKVWIWCLLKATHTPYTAIVGRQKVSLEKGQFVYGRRKAALELGFAESTVRDYMDLLVELGNIDIKPDSRFSLVTVKQWGLYQNGDENSDSRPDRTTPLKKTAKGQQTDTYKNVKNDKNDKEVIEIYSKVLDQYHSICKSLPKVIKLTDKRKKHVKARHQDFGDLETFTTLFTKAEQSDFLSGRNGKWTSCNFDWLMNPSNALKVLEGNYDNKETGTTQHFNDNYEYTERSKPATDFFGWEGEENP